MIRLPAARLWIAGAACAALFAAGWSANGWRLNAAISKLKQDHAESIAAGWQKANEKLVEERERADRIVVGAQAEARRLRAELAGRQQEFAQAVTEDVECAQQASQRLVCPRPW